MRYSPCPSTIMVFLYLRGALGSVYLTVPFNALHWKGCFVEYLEIRPAERRIQRSINWSEARRMTEVDKGMWKPAVTAIAAAFNDWLRVVVNGSRVIEVIGESDGLLFYSQEPQLELKAEQFWKQFSWSIAAVNLVHACKWANSRRCQSSIGNGED